MDSLDKIVVKAVGGIETDSVNVKFVYPEINCPDKIIGDLGISEIQLNKVVAVVPALVPEAVVIGGISAEIQPAEPAAVTGTLPVLLNVLKADEITSHMVENTVQNYSYAICVKVGTDLFEILVCTKTAVNGLIINSIITVLCGLEKRSQVNGVYVHFFQMRYPFGYLLNAVYGSFGGLVAIGFSPAEAQRVNVVEV